VRARFRLWVAFSTRSLRTPWRLLAGAPYGERRESEGGGERASAWDIVCCWLIRTRSVS
jgi:hypothetical protein